MKAIPTLLCIPDISGFTEFMSEVNFDLGSKVIPALLNDIIYSNKIDLKVSEIEGDAVLFFRTGDLPDFDLLIQQCEFFYLQFYKKLKNLREKYKNKEGAYLIPEILGLKIILHYSEEIGLVQIDKRFKLMGEDVITAHRMLKNNINLEEYILISKELIDQYEVKANKATIKELQFYKGVMEIPHIGTLEYFYKDLRPLLT
ncbi:DUF2652 domain-containing protein [Ascidiimonas sp. W6]|uniref:DUF2652 domain-containing protein n=1 Tax=Ascidiimonas meishanensis TaxID=3128903 RepID=UPI0030EE64B7